MIIKIVNLKKDIILTVKHLFKRLLESPVLLIWIIIGIISALILGGFSTFLSNIINIILLAMYAVIIKLMTDKVPAKSIPKIKHPRLELLSGILLYIFMFIEIAVLWKQVNIPYIGSAINNFELAIKNNVYKLGEIGISQLNINHIYSISMYLAITLVPVIILFILWGYNFKNMGFVFCNLPLILVLVLIDVLLGLPNKIIFKQPINIIITTYVATIFSNALSEELCDRGFLLPRLEAVLKNPINALVISAILFNISHIPSFLGKGISMYSTLFFCFSFSCPTGLIFGYLFLKTRSIVPSVLLHASNTTLGIIFISVLIK